MLFLRQTPVSRALKLTSRSDDCSTIDFSDMTDTDIRGEIRSLLPKLNNLRKDLLQKEKDGIPIEELQEGIDSYKEMDTYIFCAYRELNRRNPPKPNPKLVKQSTKVSTTIKKGGRRKTRRSSSKKSRKSTRRSHRK